MLFFWPDIPVFMRFRGWLYGLGMAHCGKNFQVTHNVAINTLGSFTIGDNVRLGIFSRLNGSAKGNCVIEDEVIIGQGTMISCGNHVFNGRNFRDAKHDESEPTKTINIGRGSWIGSNCTIIAGAAVPAHSVVAAQSCVTPKMEQKEYGIYGGVPAKFIKYMKGYETFDKSQPGGGNFWIESSSQISYSHAA